MESKITEYFKSKTKEMNTEPEITAGGQHFQMFNTGGVEVEVAELLYGLVRCWKPKFVLETGTHKGISSAYIAQALEDNQSGKLATYEIIPSLQQDSMRVWRDLKLSHRIDSRLLPSLEALKQWPDMPEIDFLFLDSEPQFRFDEFLYFWDKVAPGGLIAIHDLHPSLGHHGQTHHGTFDWPYGYWKEKLKNYVTDFKVQLIHVPNPRGMVLFQKCSGTEENVKALVESYNEAMAD